MKNVTYDTDLGRKSGLLSGGILKEVLLGVSALLMAVTLYLIFFWVPTEANLGISQRIFYFHVPLAWIGMVSIVVVAVASLMHLKTNKESWDSLAYSTAELGVVFATLILVTGAIWAKPVWGVWWSWDFKLTTTLVLWFIYVGYLMLRAYSSKGSQGRRYSSVVALFGAIDALFIILASYWWRNVHPEIIVAPSGVDGNTLNAQMGITLLVSLVAFTALYVYLLIERYSLRRSEVALDELHQKAA